LGIGDWGLGPIPNPQSPIPNPQSPFLFHIILFLGKIKIILNLENIRYFILFINYYSHIHLVILD
jgi:hypothetical protein